MDIPTYALKGLGDLAWYGAVRPAYRSLRAAHWIDTDRRDPEGADARNAAEGARARIRREWGGWWTGERWGLPLLPDLPAPTMEEQMEEKWKNGDLNLMSEPSPADLKAYHSIFFRKNLLEPFAEKMQQIIDAGPESPYAPWYRRLTSRETTDREAAMRDIEDICKDISYRTLREDQFRSKLEYEHEAAKKVNWAYIKNFLVDQWNKTLHSLNDTTMKDILEKLMKLLSSLFS
jgi:hypothetical protein